MPQYVAPELRIAVFDQDGTLWVEQPIYTQVKFAYDRVKALAPQHPEWKTREPFRTILSGDPVAMADFSIQDFEEVGAETHSGMTVEEYQAIVKQWLATARHPRFQRPYTELVYQPMLEVIQLLRASGFKTYIVTGGGQEFVRVYAQAGLRHSAGAGHRLGGQSQIPVRRGQEAAATEVARSATARRPRW